MKAVYLRALTSQLATQDQVNASATTIAGAAAGAPIDTGLTTANAGITQNVTWGGGNYAITLNNNKATTVAANQLINPAYNTNWSAVYTQPLLRGFKTDANRQAILVTKINRDISDVQTRSTITKQM